MEVEKDEFLTRIARSRGELEKRNLEALVAYSSHRDYLPGNVMYLANFFSKEEEQTVVVVTPDQEVLITDSAWDVFRAQETCPIAVTASADLSRGIVDTLRKSGISSGAVGIAGWSYFPAAIYLGITKELPRIELIETNILNEMRAIKSPSEIKLMREAARLTDKAHETAMQAISPGKKEWEIVAAAESAILEEGAQVSFISEFGSGVRTALVAPQATNKKIKAGDLCLLDMGAAYRGYHGDITRMCVAGKPTTRQVELLDFELSCLKQAIAAIRPGVKASEVHRIGKAPIVEAGYESYGGWTASGHANGLEMHEWPYLDEKTDASLQKNMVLCVEPSFTIPDLGTFRLEQMVLVKDDGCELLTNYKVDLWS
jgi:Xaa-Pro aminopeptidase